MGDGRMSDDDRLLRCSEVQSLTGLSHAAIYAMMGRGEFPKPIRIGKRAVRWRAAELNEFLSECPRGGEASPPQAKPGVPAAAGAGVVRGVEGRGAPPLTR